MHKLALIELHTDGEMAYGAVTAGLYLELCVNV